MQNEKKYFLSQDSALDSDSADFAVSQNSWVNMENFRTGSTDAGVIGTVESIGSTATINSQTPGANYLAIGTADDVENSRFVTFYKDLNGNDDKIECTYSDTDTTYVVIKGQDIISDIPNFQLKGQVSDFVSVNNSNQIVFSNTSSTANIQIGDYLKIKNTSLDGIYTVNNIASNIVSVNAVLSPCGIGQNFTLFSTSNPSNVHDFLFQGIPPFNPLNYPSGTTLNVSGINGSVNGTYTIDKIIVNSNSYIIRTLQTIPTFNYLGDFNFLIQGEISIYRNNPLLNKGLNFTKDPIHSARITNGCIYWVDSDNNEPRKINIESGIKTYSPTFNTNQKKYTLPIPFSEITVIKPTCSYAPNINKIIDTSYTSNFIQNESFEFAYQYVYNDNETSIIGSYSTASKLNNKDEKYNSILIRMNSFNKIPNSVKIVNLICRIQTGTKDGGNVANIIKTWDKDNPNELIEINNQNSLTELLSYRFYNNISGESISEDNVLRPFDNVPIYSNTLEVAKSRLFLANNIEGYNTPQKTSLSVSLSNPINSNIASVTTSIIYRLYIFWSDLNPSTMPLSYNAYVFQIPSIAPGYYTTPTSYYYAGTDINGNNVFYPSNTFSVPTNTTFSNLIYLGDNLSQIYNNLYLQVPSNMVNYSSNIWSTRLTIAGVNNNNGIVVTLPAINTFNTFEQKSIYKFGIAFYDYSMRKCGVVKNTNASEPIPIGNFISNIETVSSNTIKIYSSLANIILAKDKIIIRGSVPFAGVYTVDSISYGNIFTTITTIETVSTYASQSASIQVYRLPSLDVTTPLRLYNSSATYSGINWSLNDNNTLDEIPEWAYYYAPIKTLNLRTRFFTQSFSKLLKYATKDPITKTWVYANGFNTNTQAIALPTEEMIYSGLGYTYTEGDICILTKDDNSTFELPVIGQDGSYILIKFANAGSNINNSKFIFEIYTPYKSTNQEPYYEVGQIYNILNPKSDLRTYSVTNGLFMPDAYLIQRTYLADTYYANTMSPNDLYYKRWDTDVSKLNYITKLGQSKKTQYISWSDTFIPNTAINGLSTFRAENQKSVPEDCGSISKLQLTSKIQNEGTVMLSICTNETNSMYLGETQITDSTGGTQFFSATSQVISTINTLKGSFGTINPEAVTEFRGSVFYPDANRGVWVQYSANGLFAISNYKMTRFWKLFFKQYLSMTKAQIEALGSRPYLFSTVDASHMELLISVPKLLDVPPKGYLPDYQNQIYPFDIWDGQGKTIVYCLENVNIQPHWQGSYSFNPEQFMCIINKLYSLKNGNLYLHNQTNSFNNFYNQQYNSKIMVVANQLPQRPKVYNNVSVESNMKPLFTYFYNDYPYLQTSDLEYIDYKDLEGVFYAALYRNKIVPSNNPPGYTTDGLLTAENLRNVAMKIMLEFNPTNSPTELKFLNIGYILSKGHTT
jgi:hypothetical protein